MPRPGPARPPGRASRAERLLPGLRVLRSYQRSWAVADVVAGVSVAAYLVPQVMAYAGVAGLPPLSGLWACLPALLLYALLGSSRQLGVGPESTTALMTAIALANLAGGHPGRYAALASGLALLVGLICLLARLARLGAAADLLSRPVLVGYLAGVALLMIAGQLQRVTGVRVEGHSFLSQTSSFVRNVGQARPAPALVAATVLVFLFVVQSRFPRAPGPLLALLLATAAGVVLQLDRHGVAVVGLIPSGLPLPALPHLRPDDLRALLLPAAGIAVVGFSDNVLTARSFAARAGDVVDEDQELLALGAANLGSGLFHGFPVSSSASRTAIAEATGARTQAYSLVALFAVLVVLLFLRPLLAHFPTAALGGIVVYAAVRLIDLEGFRRLASFRRSELLLSLAACAAVLTLDILQGVAVAIGLSVADLLARVARPHDAVLGRVPGLDGMHDVDDYPTATTIPGLLVYRYDSPLFFADAEDFKRRALATVESQPSPVDWFVLNVEATVEVDITGLDALEWLRAELVQRGTVLALARVKQDLLVDLRAFGLADRIGADRMFPTLPSAVQAYEDWSAGRDGA